MSKFNRADFNLQEIIKARVNLEAEVEHAFDPIPPLPKYQKLPRASNESVGWFNFVRTMLLELAP